MGWAWHCHCNAGGHHQLGECSSSSSSSSSSLRHDGGAGSGPAQSEAQPRPPADWLQVLRSAGTTAICCLQSELSLSPSLNWKLILAAGIYADQETGCQVFHICQDGGRMDSFFCPNLTLFNQRFFVCDWWADSCCPPCWVWVSGRTMWTVTPPISTSTSTPRSIRHQRRYPTLSSRPLGSLRSVTSQSFILQFQFNHYNIFTNEILLLSWSELCFNQFI